jgi:hypothetical protein
LASAFKLVTRSYIAAARVAPDVTNFAGNGAKKRETPDTPKAGVP